MDALLEFGNVALAAEANPLLIDLGTRHDELVLAHATLNTRLTSFEVPDTPTAEWKRELDELRSSVNDLQLEMLEWEGEVRQFLKLPDLTFDSSGIYDDNQRKEVQQHLLGTLQMVRSDMGQARATMTQNYENLVFEAQYNSSRSVARRSLQYGKLGLWIGIVSIVIALISLLYALK